MIRKEEGEDEEKNKMEQEGKLWEDTDSSISEREGEQNEDESEIERELQANQNEVYQDELNLNPLLLSSRLDDSTKKQFFIDNEEEEEGQASTDLTESCIECESEGDCSRLDCNSFQNSGSNNIEDNYLINNTTLSPKLLLPQIIASPSNQIPKCKLRSSIFSRSPPFQRFTKLSNGFSCFQHKMINFDYSKVRCQSRSDGITYDVLLLTNSAENVGAISHFLSCQTVSENQCVLTNISNWEEDSYLFVVIEQFEEFFSYPTTPQKVIESIRLICLFLLASLKNKIISLDISCNEFLNIFLTSKNGQLKLGIEVFKCISRSQSKKASKFMQIETSKKFCSQIIQTIQDIQQQGCNCEELNQLINFVKKEEEKCSLQQMLNYPYFNISNSSLFESEKME